MPNYVHISGSRRRDGNAGGVEKFAWYLEKAIGCELLTDNEYKGTYDGNTIFIVDGDHGRNIPLEAPVISVAHGTWAGLHRRWLKDSINDATERSQIARWKTPNVKVVSVSPGVTHELRTICDVEPVAEIWHGVDTKLFKPRPRKDDKQLVMFASQSPGKGYNNIPELRKRLSNYFIEYLNANIGEEHTCFQFADIFLHMSLSDGNSYACLEAMACDIPSVVTNVGLFHDVDEDFIGRILPYTSTIEDYVEAIEDVYERRDYIHPRDWILSYSTFEQFQNKWQEFLSHVH